MILVSQDKREIINFDRISEIVAGEDGSISITDDIRQEDGYIIGRYKTEEKAKAIIEEIMCMYETLEILKYSNEESKNYALGLMSSTKNKDGELKLGVFELPEE